MIRKKSLNSLVKTSRKSNEIRIIWSSRKLTIYFFIRYYVGRIEKLSSKLVNSMM